MKEQSRKALKYTGTGIIAVLAVAITIDFVSPDNQVGMLLRFLGPLLTGFIIGVWIHSKIASEIDPRARDQK